MIVFVRHAYLNKHLSTLISFQLCPAALVWKGLTADDAQESQCKVVLPGVPVWHRPSIQTETNGKQHHSVVFGYVKRSGIRHGHCPKAKRLQVHAQFCCYFQGFHNSISIVGLCRWSARYFETMWEKSRRVRVAVEITITKSRPYSSISPRLTQFQYTWSINHIYIITDHLPKYLPGTHTVFHSFQFNSMIKSERS